MQNQPPLELNPVAPTAKEVTKHFDTVSSLIQTLYIMFHGDPDHKIAFGLVQHLSQAFTLGLEANSVAWDLANQNIDRVTSNLRAVLTAAGVPFDKLP